MGAGITGLTLGYHLTKRGYSVTIFEKNDFDESFTEKEIELIDKIIEKTIKSDKLIDAKDYFKESKWLLQ